MLPNRLHRVGQALDLRAVHRRLSGLPARQLLDDTVTSGSATARSTSSRPTPRSIERCMLMCTDPGRPRARPDVWVGHDGLRSGAVGAPLDHDRHVAGRAGARPSAADGGEVPVLPARRLARGRSAKEASAHGVAPSTDPTTGDIRHGFVYERVQHITLKSIANNPDIDEGMSREEIDEAIKRHADFELLYDKPYEDKQEGAGRRAVHCREPVAAPLARLRRRGPRRHRRRRRKSEQAADLDASAEFEQMILENLVEGRHPERPQERAASVRHGRAVRRALRPGRRRRARRRTAAPSARRHRDRSAVRHGRTVRSSSTPPARRSGADNIDLLAVLALRVRPECARALRRVPGGRRRLRGRRPSAQWAGCRCCSCG